MVAWRCSTEGNGEQSATTVGTLGMPTLCVDNLDIGLPPKHFQVPRFEMVLDGYGWITSVVPEKKKVWPTATIENGEPTIAFTGTMLELNVQQCPQVI